MRAHAHIRPAFPIINGRPNGSGPDFSGLGDHWPPVTLTGHGAAPGGVRGGGSAPGAKFPKWWNSGRIGLHVCTPDAVLLWDGENAPRWEPWAVADVGQPEFTVASVRAGKTACRAARRHGYLVSV